MDADSDYKYISLKIAYKTFVLICDDFDAVIANKWLRQFN